MVADGGYDGWFWWLWSMMAKDGSIWLVKADSGGCWLFCLCSSAMLWGRTRPDTNTTAWEVLLGLTTGWWTWPLFNRICAGWTENRMFGMWLNHRLDSAARIRVLQHISVSIVTSLITFGGPLQWALKYVAKHVSCSNLGISQDGVDQ